MLPDSEIIRRIRNGDAGQFESLFRSSYVPLVRYAKTLIKDQDSAEEIVQDLFYRLWATREKLVIEKTLNGYLYRAVHNLCLHTMNHRKVVENHAREMASRIHETPENPVDIINYRELQAKIAMTLERLPEKCGKIFCMSRFEGLKYTEIAERLSLSVKTVEANMGKALREFRKTLEEH